MRRLLTIVAVLLLGASSAVPVMAKEWTEEVVVLTDTTIFGIPAELVPLAPPSEGSPGSNWVSQGVWHVRGLPVGDTVRDAATGEILGTLTRSVNFNLHLASGASQAWCTFSLVLEIGDLAGEYEGNCRGDLISGTLNGHGGGVLRGTYQLGPGGAPGAGPYFLELLFG